MRDEPPKISVVTPSYNQARYLERTIKSVINQNYPNLEYVIMDGGSTDGSVSIIQKYEDQLQFWVSQKDDGQYDAINKGFMKTTGEIMAWLNADDEFLPWAFRIVGEVLRRWPQIEWITTSRPMAIDQDDNAIKLNHVHGFNRSGFLHGDNLLGAGWRGTHFIQQESTFWRRSLWDRAGAHLEASLNYAGDFELWARFFEHAQLFSIDVPLSCFRRHDDQKTSVAMAQYLKEAKGVFFRSGGKEPRALTQILRLKTRDFLSSSLRQAAFRLKLIEPAPGLTYDWGSGQWTLTER